MRISDLITELQAHEAEFGDIEVRTAQQPKWAFEYSIDRVEVATTIDDDDRDAGKKTVVYLSEGRQIGYLPGSAAYVLGWSDCGDNDDDQE